MVSARRRGAALSGLVSRLAAGLVAGLLLAMAAPAGAEAAVLRAWVAYGADGQVRVRAVADGLACPLVNFDGRFDAMDRRYGPSGAFPVHVCEAVMPPGTRLASIEGQSLPVAVGDPRHIVVLGDTGCRLKGDKIQACNDPAAWPFARIADLAAAEHPDLVIHVGDYLYRETPCPPGDDRCAGTSWGDNWPTWDADFFAPAALLLKAAPWITLRGNHEDCKRAGTGWTLLLAPDPVEDRCSLGDKPYLVSFPGWRLAVVDDNDADENRADPAVAARLHRDLAAALAGKPDWLLTHHPPRGVKEDAAARPGQGRLAGANATLIAALSGLDERGLKMMLSGHIHNFQVEDYGGAHPPQLVAGVGGDWLERTPSRFTGRSGDAEIRAGQALVTFGYLVLDRQADGWAMALHGADGRVLRRCRLAGRSLSCP